MNLGMDDEDLTPEGQAAMIDQSPEGQALSDEPISVAAGQSSGSVGAMDYSSLPVIEGKNAPIPVGTTPSNERAALKRQLYADLMNRANPDSDVNKISKEDRRDLRQQNNQNALLVALNKAAAQAGSVGGKTAEVSGLDELSQNLSKSGAQQLSGLQKEQSDRDKLKEYLLAKMSNEDIAGERARQAALLAQQQLDLKKQIIENTDAYRKSQIASNTKQREADRDLKREEFQARANQEKAIKPDQANAAIYARRIEEAENNFKDLADSGYDAASKKAALSKFLPDVLKGENPKLQEQAERNFVNAVLRRESGAAISPSEFESAEKQYFPRVGDTPAVLAQKKANREIVLNGLKVAAGPAYDKVLPPTIAKKKSPAPASGTAMAAPAGKPKKVIQNGHEYILNEQTGEYE